MSVDVGVGVAVGLGVGVSQCAQTDRQTDKIPRNCLALSIFGFSMAHFCFAFFVAASDICFHISGHTLPGLEAVCFHVSLLLDHVYPSGCLSFNEMNLVKPVHATDNSLSPSTFQ